MPIVNYVREHTRFIEYASDEHLSAGERLLWYALMHIFNQRASGNVWPGEYIRISNDRLLTFCPMRYDALAAARNGLKQRGLIDYVRGEKNKTSPMYRMVYFSPEEPPESQGYTEKTDNIRGNMGGNNGGKPGGNVGDIPINLKDNQTGLCDEEEEEGARAGGTDAGTRTSSGAYAPPSCASEMHFGQLRDCREAPQALRSVAQPASSSPSAHCAELAFAPQQGKAFGTNEDAGPGASAEEMRGAWRTHFGRDPGPAVGEELARRADLLGFCAELMEMAISITAVRCTDSPMDYLGEVLRDWKSAKVRTVQDAERYLYLRDAVREGREGALGEMMGFRERGADTSNEPD